MKNKVKTTSHDEKAEMKTLSSCVNGLTREGFVTQFKITKGGLKSLSTERVYKPEEVKIVSFYRFEGESDPADNSIIYAIETAHEEKGMLIDAYGTYSDVDLAEFVARVEKIEKKPHHDGSTTEISKEEIA